MRCATGAAAACWRSRRSPTSCGARRSSGCRSSRCTPRPSSRACADLCVLFLDAKGIVGARGHEVTPLQRVLIAQQACVLVLNLDLALYDGFENIVVYPDEFLPGWEWEDEAGVVHKHDEPLAGEAMPNGPVVLSWPDVEAAADWHASGMNLVVHEFAHKIDMATGDANGCPPLPPDMPARRVDGSARGGLRRLRRCAWSAASARRSTTTLPRARASSSPCSPRCSSRTRRCCSTSTRGLRAVPALLPPGSRRRAPSCCSIRCRPRARPASGGLRAALTRC